MRTGFSTRNSNAQPAPLARAVRALDRLVLGRLDPARREALRVAALRHPPKRTRIGSPLAYAVLAALAAYRKTVPDAAKPACRFTPSCSRYASRAVQKYGVRNGLQRALFRVHRCVGFGGGGVDEP